VDNSRMKCISYLAWTLALVVGSAGVATAADVASDAKLLEKAKQIHARIVTFDSHLDLPFDYAGAATDGKTQFDLPKVVRGQLKGAALAVFVPQGPRTPEGFAKARADADKKYGLIKAIADDNPERAAIAYSPEDVKRISEQGKFALSSAFSMRIHLVPMSINWTNGTDAACAFSGIHTRATTNGQILRAPAKPSTTDRTSTKACLNLASKA